MKKHWIAGAISHPGSLRRSLHVKPGQKIPRRRLMAAAHSRNPTTARRARLAMTLSKLRKKKHAYA